MTVVPTRSGPVRGERRADGSACFLGIPYAQPPVGALRFAAPVAPEPWSGVLDATAYGPTAQRRPFAEVTTIPEPTIPGAGTLNLNVFTPAADPSAGLPVLVWIHGGGYVAGSAASPWYDGAAFNRDGVVLVTVGYRLGVEGFLHLPDAPDNRGVRDWVAALEWVRDNIAGFGGDPAKVTVAGQSAGGGAVQTLLAVPAARGLLRAAISASGAVLEPDAPAVARTLAERTGAVLTAEALQDASDEQLLALQDALGDDGDSLLALAPCVDGELVTRPVAEAVAESEVPLLLGFTAHEFAAPGPAAPGGPEVDAMLAALGLDPERAARFHAENPGAGSGEVLTDWLFRAPALALAEARVALGRPTWLYQFEWTGSAPGRAGQAYHCTDLPFAFDALAAEGVEEALGARPPQALADAVHTAWVAFVRELDPAWPPYRDGRATMRWGAEARVERDPLRAVREIWAG
ncbi:carboxylesterase/lipase family protein [Kitasatospora sp. NPDC004615]|uniref:carboxylesterase/lipase family protein n=1 Tax=Kitasatospora sp. NPDC004615 TaxID=3364017 RepID=UPI00367CC1F0